MLAVANRLLGLRVHSELLLRIKTCLLLDVTSVTGVQVSQRFFCVHTAWVAQVAALTAIEVVWQILFQVLLRLQLLLQLGLKVVAFLSKRPDCLILVTWWLTKRSLRWFHFLTVRRHYSLATKDLDLLSWVLRRGVLEVVEAFEIALTEL